MNQVNGYFYVLSNVFLWLTLAAGLAAVHREAGGRGCVHWHWGLLRPPQRPRDQVRG